MAKKGGEKRKRKKPLLSKGVMLFLILATIFILFDVAVYFYYYVPKMSGESQPFETLDTGELEVPAFLIALSLSDEPRGKLVDIDMNERYIFEVKHGKTSVISTQVPEELLDVLQSSQGYLVREFTPIKMNVIFSRPKGYDIPESYFDYKESPFLPDMLALLVSQGHNYAEVVPLYWEGDDRLTFKNRMFVFPDERRLLDNRSVYIEYAHLIGEGLFGAVDNQVKKMAVASRDAEIITFLEDNYITRDNLLLSMTNNTSPVRRTDTYVYTTK